MRFPKTADRASGWLLGDDKTMGWIRGAVVSAVTTRRWRKLMERKRLEMVKATDGPRVRR
jgi:hypothetical protein